MIKIEVKSEGVNLFTTDDILIIAKNYTLSHDVFFNNEDSLAKCLENIEIIEIDIYFTNAKGIDCLLYNFSFIIEDFIQNKNGFFGNLIIDELVSYDQYVINFMSKWTNLSINWEKLNTDEKKAYLLCCFYWSGIPKKVNVKDLIIDASQIYEEYDIYYYLSKNFGQHFYFGQSIESFEDCMCELNYPLISITNSNLLKERLDMEYFNFFMEIIKVKPKI
ncbi:Barstar (barnase inhibitor) domain-containing protein [Flavobacterium branchiophilum]|uniref:Barstar (barnase inhibitor) domain-containing protein n=1 Tax=Flavobacterium branchiophilum (strain FL-15) TaxID=1034807 RepID=G2Z6J8_FLABF|nr:hypothetical protein [Flavobacterium branchiophilum]CCB68354.1 Hypothetical protein FBFL15_0206 [Flavobacterium branchiophilum FL-15]